MIRFGRRLSELFAYFHSEELDIRDLIGLCVAEKIALNEQHLQDIIIIKGNIGFIHHIHFELKTQLMTNIYLQWVERRFPKNNV